MRFRTSRTDVMRKKALNQDYLLSRVDLLLPIQFLLMQAASAYGLSEIQHYELLRDGIEELNIKIITKKREAFIVKIFSKKKTSANIHDYVKGLIEFAATEIPVPKLLKVNGAYLWETKGIHGITYLCIMEFFKGKNFVKIKPSNEDLKTLTKYLAKIHTLRIQIEKNYDSWGAANLLTEFEDKKMYLEPEDLRPIQKVVDEFLEVDFHKFRQSIIHGGLERANVLKNAQGGICILDFGTLDFNAIVIDLAIFIAHFSFGQETMQKIREIYFLIVNEYMKYHDLNQAELKYLPCLVKAAYAMFILEPLYLRTVKKDTTSQIRAWLKFGTEGLERFTKSWNNL